MVFPVVMYGCESWTMKKAEHWIIDSFELCYWRRLLRVPWTSRRSNQSTLKEISPEYSLEGLTLKLKLQYFGTCYEELTHLKRLWCWELLKAVGEGTTEDELAGLHHWLNGREFAHALGTHDGQTSLVYCSPRGQKESDMTEWLNWTELYNIPGPPYPSTIISHDSFPPILPGFQSILSMHFCACHSLWLWSPFPAVSFKTFTVNFTARPYPTFSSSVKTYFLFLRRFSGTFSVPIVTVNVLLLKWSVTLLKVLFTYVSFIDCEL